MEPITMTFFYEDDQENPVIIKKELTSHIINDTIRSFIRDQFKHNFGAIPSEYLLEMLVNGFILFNLHKNKYMLHNKYELIKYVNDKCISLEEKAYFTEIVLYVQKPIFLTNNEVEEIRAAGHLFSV
jgi:hypothetical protein